MLRIDINLLFTVINILILFAAVRIFLWKPIHRILDERQSQVEKDFEEAASAKAEAEAAARRQQDLIAETEQQREQLLAETSRQAHAESARVISAARIRADGILQKANEQAQLRKDTVLRESRDDITEIILAATAKAAGTATEDNRRLYDRFLAQSEEQDHE